MQSETFYKVESKTSFKVESKTVHKVESNAFCKVGCKTFHNVESVTFCKVESQTMCKVGSSAVPQIINVLQRSTKNRVQQQCFVHEHWCALQLHSLEQTFLVKPCHTIEHKHSGDNAWKTLRIVAMLDSGAS